MAAEKRYFWFKLRDEFFQQKAIRLLQAEPQGEKLVVFYLKLLLASIRDEGVVTYDGMRDTLAEELALQLEEDLETVERALPILERYKLLVPADEAGERYILPEAAENLGSEGASAQRMRNMRARKEAGS